MARELRQRAVRSIRRVPAFERVLDDYIARELEYDAETNHGASMGAIFP
jgi:hypothetical protein